MKLARSSNAKDAPSPTFDLNTNLGIGGSPTVTPDPNPAGLDGQANVDTDRSDGPRQGWVYALGTVISPGTSDPADIRIAHSTDRGATWSASVKAAPEAAGANAWQWFGTLGVAPDGRLDVVYNDGQGTGSVYKAVTKYTTSADGGATWSAPVPLGPVWGSSVGWPQQNKIGDYYDISSDRTGCYVVYATTYNGEQDVYVARVGPYDCNGNGVDDALEIANGSSRDRNGNGIPDECEIAAGTLCPSDYNGDGFVNGIDFDSFIYEFVYGTAAADYNGDGFTNGVDFDQFTADFVAGC